MSEPSATSPLPFGEPTQPVAPSAASDPVSLADTPHDLAFGAERPRRVGLLRAAAGVLLRTVRGMATSPVIQGTVIGAVALLLLLGGVTRLLLSNGAVVVDALGRDVAMVVYLSDDVTAARVAQLSDALGKLPGVASVHRVTRAEAQERLRRSLGERGDFLEGTEETLLPQSLEVSFRNGVDDILRVHPFYDRLRGSEGVQDVELMGDWVRRLLRVQLALRRLGLWLGVLLGAAGLLVVGGAIHLGVHARREELDVLRLVGATDLHIALPLLLEGVLQGLVGALVALGLLVGLWHLAEPAASALLRDLLGEVRLSFLSPREILLGVAASAAVGLVGSRLALRRVLRS